MPDTGATLYLPLPPVQAAAAADTTGLNPANLSTVFDSTDLPKPNVFEIWHIACDGTPNSADQTGKLLIRNRRFTHIDFDAAGRWDWHANGTAIEIQNGWSVWLLWDFIPQAGNIGTTLWLRWNPTHPSNTGLLPPGVAL